MNAIDEINQTITNFLRPEVIFEAQIRAFKNSHFHNTQEEVANSYMNHLLSFLIKGLRNGKLTSEGKQMAILAQNPKGEILQFGSRNKGRDKPKRKKESGIKEDKKLLKAKHNNPFTQKEVLQYFERCNFFFKESVRGRIQLKKLKTEILKFVQRDPDIFEKLKSAKTFEEIIYSLPTQDKMQNLIKLHQFDVNSSKERFYLSLHEHNVLV